MSHVTNNATFRLTLSHTDAPPSAQVHIENTWPNIFRDILQEYNLYPDNISCHSSSRHTVISCNLQEHASEQIHLGPNCNAGQDALNGFIKKFNIISYKEVDTPKGRKWQGIAKCCPVAELIPEIVSNLISQTVWPYTVFNWIRPVLEICCTLDEKVIEFFVNRLQIHTSNNVYVHPKIHNANIQTFNPIDDLKLYGIITKFSEKLDSVLTQIDEIQKSQITSIGMKATTNGAVVPCHKGNISPRPAYNSLLHECIRITPQPHIIICDISEDFRNFHNDLITTVLTSHLKLIPCFDESKYIMIANHGIDDACVKFNMEQTIDARLHDMKFFYNKDLTLTLEQHRERLKEREVFPGLGTYFDKNRRIQSLIYHFFPDDHQLLKEAELVYADLCTSMVEEFPELEGTMARIYSGQSNCSDKLLTWCKNLDTLVGFAMLGRLPSGSSDPFCLRRAAMNFVQIGFQEKFTLDWKVLAEYLCKLYRIDASLVLPSLESFIMKRALYILKDYPYASLILKSEDSIWNAQDKCKMHSITEIQEIQKRLVNLIKPVVSLAAPVELQEIDTLLKSITTDISDKVIILTQCAKIANNFLNIHHMESIKDRAEYDSVLWKLLQETQTIISIE